MDEQQSVAERAGYTRFDYTVNESRGARSAPGAIAPDLSARPYDRAPLNSPMRAAVSGSAKHAIAERRSASSAARSWAPRS